MKIQSRYFWILLVIIIIISAFFIVIKVKNNIPKNNITKTELKAVKEDVNIRFLRYEKDLFSLDLNKLPQEVEKLSKIYPPTLIEPDIWKDSERMEGLRAYLQDTVIINLYKTSEKVIDFDIIEKELHTAFSYYKVLYPNDLIPDIITMIPGLVLSLPSTYIYDDFLYVNVDMYLGANNPYYEKVGLPLYISERCEPVYIPVDIFKKAIVYKHLPYTQSATLLESMIIEGKKLYFTEMMFPVINERYIIGYSEEKYSWAKDYLGNIWSYMIEKNELFGKGEALIRCYIEESPFTKTFGNSSPGRLGAFVGWKLVQSYMKNNPEVTLPELMQEVDYQKILNNSKFKPEIK